MSYEIPVPPNSTPLLRKTIETINFLRALPEEVEREIFDEELGFTIIKRQAPLNRINVYYIGSSASPIEALKQILTQAGIRWKSSGSSSLYFSTYPE